MALLSTLLGLARSLQKRLQEDHDPLPKTVWSFALHLPPLAVVALAGAVALPHWPTASLRTGPPTWSVARPESTTGAEKEPKATKAR